MTILKIYFLGTIRYELTIVFVSYGNERAFAGQIIESLFINVKNIL